MTLTPERIEKIRKRLKAATPGPWFLERDYLSVSTSWTDPEDPHDDGGGWNLALAVDTGPRPHNDASLIANAPSDLAALLAHITAQQERIERLGRILAAEQGREGLEGWRWAGDCWERIVFGPKRLGPPSPLARAWPGGRLWTRHDNWLRGAGHDCLEAMEAAEAALRGEG
jgi:hypothetical protein